MCNKVYPYFPSLLIQVYNTGVYMCLCDMCTHVIHVTEMRRQTVMTPPPPLREREIMTGVFAIVCEWLRFWTPVSLLV